MKRLLTLVLATLALVVFTSSPARADDVDYLDLPVQCRIETTICVDTSLLLLYFLEDGSLIRTFDIRIGAPQFATDLGEFRVYRKARQHRSTAYKTPMPYSLFYNGAESIHYSPSFKRDGYNGASRGCVNLRNFRGAGWLYRHSPIGTRVYVY
jgi:lipoprotein-anchoring transpeptidase ErfK/SrfK